MKVYSVLVKTACKVVSLVWPTQCCENCEELYKVTAQNLPAPALTCLERTAVFLYWNSLVKSVQTPFAIATDTNWSWNSAD